MLWPWKREFVSRFTVAPWTQGGSLIKGRSTVFSGSSLPWLTESKCKTRLVYIKTLLSDPGLCRTVVSTSCCDRENVSSILARGIAFVFCIGTTVHYVIILRKHASSLFLLAFFCIIFIFIFVLFSLKSVIILTVFLVSTKKKYRRSLLNFNLNTYYQNARYFISF